MSLNGSGVFNVNTVGQPVVTDTTITAAAFNAYTADVAAALSTALYKDGQQLNAANQAMGGYRLTGLGAGTSPGDSVRYEQVAKINGAGVNTDITGLAGVTSIELGHASDTTITRASAGVIAVEGSAVLLASGLGSITQAYDVDTAKTDVAQTFTAAQRGTVTTDNDGSFSQSVTNNFFCTPTGAVALTFTNHTAGQSGLILFVNSSNYAVTAAATTYIAAADLAKLGTSGTYLISYLDNGTNAYCVVSAALTSAGV